MLTETQLREVLLQGDFAPVHQPWLAVARDLATLEAIGRTGWIFLLKVDGLRTSHHYTVVLNRATPGSDTHRCDGNELGPILRGAIQFFIDAK
ncbi:MAG: hypothetical protein QM817_02425 [Archangium sp.]